MELRRRRLSVGGRAGREKEKAAAACHNHVVAALHNQPYPTGGTLVMVRVKVNAPVVARMAFINLL